MTITYESKRRIKVKFSLLIRFLPFTFFTFFFFRLSYFSPIFQFSSTCICRIANWLIQEVLFYICKKFFIRNAGNPFLFVIKFLDFFLDLQESSVVFFDYSLNVEEIV